MKRRLVFSCDPGKMSGVTMFDITEMKSDDAKVEKVWSAEWPEDDFYMFLWNMFQNAMADKDVELEVVVENFIITVQTAKLGAGPWSLKYIGAIEMLCKVYNVPFTLQQPQQKDFAPNDRIRNLGMWHRGGDGHALDAIRHAIIYLVMKHKWRPEGLLDDKDETEEGK